ncbi:hypothetical protein HanRHA438_Chr00c06g0845931 [Helianthus annuus]|nr:hypothetical protein HanRHA438_Chr00c06g0845931 [Helianthus annuus]
MSHSICNNLSHGNDSVGCNVFTLIRRASINVSSYQTISSRQSSLTLRVSFNCTTLLPFKKKTLHQFELDYGRVCTIRVGFIS